MIGIHRMFSTSFCLATRSFLSTVLTPFEKGGRGSIKSCFLKSNLGRVPGFNVFFEKNKIHKSTQGVNRRLTISSPQASHRQFCSTKNELYINNLKIPPRKDLIKSHFLKSGIGAVARAERSNVSFEANKIYKFIQGADQRPTILSLQETNKWLLDPFAALVLKKNEFPLNLRDILDTLEGTRGSIPGLTKVSVYHIAEGGQIPWTPDTAKLNRTFRLALALDIKSSSAAPKTDIFISTGKEVTSNTQFLQLMSWDSKNLGFNFYQRLQNTWFWAGNSRHALESQTRGKGPFSGHINGGPVMKELKIPWPHWHSMNKEILPSIFAPNDPFVNDRLFTDTNLVQGGENLESRIRSSISRWNLARMQMEITQNQVAHPEYLLRQLLDTTNINLTSASIPSDQIDNGTSIPLPFTFFIAADIFSAIGLSLRIPQLELSGELYLKSLKKFDFSLVSGFFKQNGETYFAFLVPEPAAEDTDLLTKMIEKEIISTRFAACLFMVDFTNPIFSPSRARLLKYIPTQLTVGEKGKDLTDKFVNALKASSESSVQNSPEKEFLEYWAIPEDQWALFFEGKIETYFQILKKKLETQEGVDDIVRLAESKRFLFKKLALSEFDLTFATTNIPTSLFPLEIKMDGSIRHLEGVIINNQGDM